MLLLISNINQVLSGTDRYTIIDFSIRIFDTVHDLTS